MTKLLNLARLERRIRKLPAEAKNHIKAALEGVADSIVDMMKGLVAVDDGALRDSIGWTWGKAPKGSMAIATVKGSLGSDLTITIFAGSADAYYARWIEFGTSPHLNGGVYAGSKHPGTKSQPFFYVSWRANKKSARRAVRKAVRDSAKKVASGS